MTKSKNLNLYLPFLKYNDPQTIPFNDLAEEYGVPANKLRGMMRSARSDKGSIFLGLVEELGVSPSAIPDWFGRPRGHRRRRRKSNAEPEKVQSAPKINPQPTISTTPPQVSNPIVVQPQVQYVWNPDEDAFEMVPMSQYREASYRFWEDPVYLEKRRIELRQEEAKNKIQFLLEMSFYKNSKLERDRQQREDQSQYYTSLLVWDWLLNEYPRRQEAKRLLEEIQEYLKNGREEQGNTRVESLKPLDQPQPPPVLSEMEEAMVEKVVDDVLRELLGP